MGELAYRATARDERRILTGEDAWERLAELAEQAVRDEAAWAAWWEGTAPHIEQWAASPSFVGRLAVDDDHRREIVIQAWEKLQERQCAKLRAFFERPATEPGSNGRRLKVWLRRVVKNIAIDYMRTLPEFVRKRPRLVVDDGPPRSMVSHDYWRSIVSITSNVAAFADPSEGRAEAQRMLEYLENEISPRRRRAVELADAGMSSREIARALGLRTAVEADRIVGRARERLKFRAALELWSHGYSDAEIAAELGLEDESAADRMVKAAKELLRRAFK
jgi:DNA-directed RNA polymerase specialized sigma24 family protein